MPPPVPAAGPSVPPPLAKLKFVNQNGFLTIDAISFLTQFWAAVIGDAGITETIAALQTDVVEIDAQITIIFGMHGDGTLAIDGTLIVTATNGVPFGYFATGTDAAELTGTLNPDLIADGSLPYLKLADTSQPVLLGADAAGPVVEIIIGTGLDIAAGNLRVTPTPGVAVSALGAATGGLRNFVNDASVVAAGNFGTVVAGGGANFVPVYADGGSWRIG